LSLRQTKTKISTRQQGERVVDQPTREWLLERLRTIIDYAMDKVTGARTPPDERVKWSRIAVSAGQACNSVLRDVDIETLKQQVRELKELTLAKLGDEQGENSEGDREATTQS
jgi:hypothetical protein